MPNMYKLAGSMAENSSPESSASTIDPSMEKEIDPRDVPFWCSSRLALAVIGFFGTLNLYALRINLSVGLVCMVNQTASLETIVLNSTYNATYQLNSSWTTSTPDDMCPRRAGATSNETTDGEFSWDKKTQGLILGSFFWGYLITQLPGGLLASRFGAKRVIGLFMIATSIATLLVPIGARTHYIFLLALRVICGMGSGIWFPCFHIMWANWAPPMERSKLMSLTYSGAQLGNVLTLPIAGLLCKYGFGGGWPSIFYIMGALSLLWCILWLALVSDSPVEHKRISNVEKAYIIHSLKGEMKSHRSKKLKIPVKSIVMSLPVWAIIVANVTSDWGIYTFLTNIPSYMNEVLKFEITENGFLSSIPYLLFWGIILIAGLLTDTLRVKSLLSTTHARKVLNSIGMLCPALLIIVLGFLDCTQAYLAVGLLSVGVSMSGCVFSGFIPNPVDIAPKYSGIIFAISNSLASITGFAAPYLVGIITSDKTKEQWQIVFFICAGINVFGALFYIFAASGEIQSWAREDEEQTSTHAELQDLNVDKDAVPANGMPIYNNEAIAQLIV